MKYQLVLQLPAGSIQDYNNMVGLEEDIIEAIGKLGDVDGHDFGSGETNIFILTDYPQRIFDQITSQDIMDDFAIIYPTGLKNFVLK